MLTRIHLPGLEFVQHEVTVCFSVDKFYCFCFRVIESVILGLDFFPFELGLSYRTGCWSQFLFSRGCSLFAGTKFFVVSEPGTQHMEGLLKHIYELYTDYVLKNPFYEMERPIQCELFDINLTQAVQKDRVVLLAR
ncbi:hypothetical protein C1H46_013719 [Malus baccata]|uniref:Trafficking protein particle complex subunit n=1 Tax=Malus baccata TaxID=106549 RepID=A0A540MQN0_MALBA|nr:hypothetical protein C1H46_013719 [Malus baccata]